MKLTFNIKYDSGVSSFNGLDMYYGADSFGGFAEALSLTTHAIVNNKVIKQTTAAKGFKLDFKEAHDGSYVQKVCLEFTDAEAVRVVEYLGAEGFIQLLNFHLSSPLGLNAPITNNKAIRWHRTLMDGSEMLLERLSTSLEKIHHPVSGQGYSISLSKNRTHMMSFNERTLDYLTGSIYSEEHEVIEAGVSRLNARTLTGRIIEEMDSDSISFSPYKVGLLRPARLLLANSLRDLTEDVLTKVALNVRRILSRDGRTKHLIVYEVNEL